MGLGISFFCTEIVSLAKHPVTCKLIFFFACLSIQSGLCNNHITHGWNANCFRKLLFMRFNLSSASFQLFYFFDFENMVKVSDCNTGHFLKYWYNSTDFEKHLLRTIWCNTAACYWWLLDSFIAPPTISPIPSPVVADCPSNLLQKLAEAWCIICLVGLITVKCTVHCMFGRRRIIPHSRY